MTAVALPGSYYRVVGATGLANLADGIRMAAFPLLAASLTDRPLLIALVFAAGEAPWLVIGLWAGKVVDVVDRRRLVQAVTACRTVILAGLACLVLFEVVPLWFVAVTAFALGVFEVLADTVTGALVPSLVPDGQLERANSRMVGVQIVGDELIGPAVGGLLFAVGASIPFFTNASLLALALVILAGLAPLTVHTIEADDGEGPMAVAEADTRAETEAEAGSVPEGAVGAFDGFPFILGRPLLATLTGASAVLAAVDAAWFALLVLFVGDRLGLGPGGFGLLLAIGAVGGLAGAFVADRRPDWSITVVAALVFGSSALSLLALGMFPTVVVTAAVLVVTSGAFALWNVHAVSMRQRLSPNEMLGRVGATYKTLVIGASLMGAMVGGLAAEASSIGRTLVVAGIVLAVAGLTVSLLLKRADQG